MSSKQSLFAIMGIQGFIEGLLWLIFALSPAVAGSEWEPRDLSIGDIPACGITCVSLYMPQSQCKIDDFSCICKDDTLQKTAKACMVANCTMADNLETARVNKQLCNLPDETQKDTIRKYTIGSYVVALSSVCLRGAGRYASNKLSWNDAPIVAAVVLAAVPISSVLEMTSLGFGDHLWSLEDGRLLPILRYFYIAWSTYIAILGLIKVSLIMFYLEIFTTRRFKIMGWFILSYIIINTLIILFLTIFACTPIETFWNRDLLLGDGKCMNIQIIGYANSASAIVQDIILLVLPMFFIKNLNMKRYRKIAVGLMFAIGSFGCITTIIRLQTLLVFKISFDPTWDYVPIVIWTELEITSCLICVSLPSIRVLVMRLFPRNIKDWLLQVAISSRSNGSSGGIPRYDTKSPYDKRGTLSTWNTLTPEKDYERIGHTGKGTIELTSSSVRTPSRAQLSSPESPRLVSNDHNPRYPTIRGPSSDQRSVKGSIISRLSTVTTAKSVRTMHARFSRTCENITALPRIYRIPEPSDYDDDFTRQSTRRTRNDLV
ncbi:hypothetical protein BS50DRAFT_294417 [Corynespora cassiicola Philippines]|uniref:Uncharacterized protein n=1 Tax=Corynespora cassiicola Philippines TaxID=1448308 RepID=A0A2T2NWN9_CORCC|nr:hypothetical protein BS50DRAFT_294417 [Corynespora cassiicola Philippines]